MNAYDVKNLLDNLETARLYAGAEFGRLCNNNQHIDACVFQSIRDSIAQNIQLLQSYVFCKEESENRMSKETTCENCINANVCIMYEPKMKRCKDYKESED